MATKHPLISYHCKQDIHKTSDCLSWTDCGSHYNILKKTNCRSQWPRGLRRRSTAARLLRWWVRIPPGAWMSLCCECCVLSVRGLCDELITRPEESYRLWSVVVCDLEKQNSWMRRPRPTGGLSRQEKINQLTSAMRIPYWHTLHQTTDFLKVYKWMMYFFKRFMTCTVDFLWETTKKCWYRYVDLLQSVQPATCFGHLSWSSSGRLSLKECDIES